MNGILLVNKEKDMTSRDVVNFVSKCFNTKKIGHTGTLDPMAEGVLVLAIGNCLKLVEDITSYDKEYESEITLGIDTDTLDITGNLLKEETTDVSIKEIDDVLNSFIGNYKMEVPKYSAIRVNGKKLYEYARNNEDVELPVKNVYVNDIKRISDIKYVNNRIVFSIRTSVSKGTYIRSLIRDIAKELNTIGVMSKLVRIKQGNFNIKDCYTLNQIENNDYKLLSIKDVINLPIVSVDEFLYKKIMNGSKLENRYEYEKFCFEYNNTIIAIYIIDPNDSTKVKPKKVFK